MVYHQWCFLFFLSMVNVSSAASTSFANKAVPCLWRNLWACAEIQRMKTGNSNSWILDITGVTWVTNSCGGTRSVPQNHGAANHFPMFWLGLVTGLEGLKTAPCRRLSSVQCKVGPTCLLSNTPSISLEPVPIPDAYKGTKSFASIHRLPGTWSFVQPVESWVPKGSGFLHNENWSSDPGNAWFVTFGYCRKPWNKATIVKHDELRYH